VLIGCSASLTRDSCVVFAISCAPILIDLFTDRARRVFFWEISGIFTALTIASSANFLGLGAAWGGMLIFDALVFGMTLYKSLTLPRLRGVNLLSVLFRDG